MFTTLKFTTTVASAAVAVATITPAFAQMPTADINVSDRPGSVTYTAGQTAVGKIRVFNNNAVVGKSSFGVTATIEPIAASILSLTPRGGSCVRGANGSQICNLNRLDGQYAKFVEFDVALSPSACANARNGQVKIATASVTAKTLDPNMADNATSVYVKISCQ